MEENKIVKENENVNISEFYSQINLKEMNEVTKKVYEYVKSLQLDEYINVRLQSTYENFNKYLIIVDGIVFLEEKDKYDNLTKFIKELNESKFNLSSENCVAIYSEVQLYDTRSYNLTNLCKLNSDNYDNNNDSKVEIQNLELEKGKVYLIVFWTSWCELTCHKINLCYQSSWKENVKFIGMSIEESLDKCNETIKYKNWNNIF